MLLASSLEPAGPKSTHHYLVLHHKGLRELVHLPKEYSDLEKEVKRLYHLDADRFYVESKELNICAGERVKLPKVVWSDLAELLGNVYIVQCEIVPNHDLIPGPEIVPSQSTHLSTADQTPASANAPPTPATPTNQVTSAAQANISENPSDANVESASLSLDTENLYQQILTCNPRNAAHVSGTLEGIRNATTVQITTGIKLLGQTPFPSSAWSNCEWSLNPRSIYAIRFTLAEPASQMFLITFGPLSGYCLDVHCYRSDVSFTVKKMGNTGNDIMNHSIRIAGSMQSAGEHTIAFINEGDKLRVAFDFRESFVLPEIAHTTMLERKPDMIWIHLDGKCTVAVDVYEFN